MSSDPSLGMARWPPTGGVVFGDVGYRGELGGSRTAPTGHAGETPTLLIMVDLGALTKVTQLLPRVFRLFEKSIRLCA